MLTNSVACQIIVGVIMIIKSYLVFPLGGRISELEQALSSISACEVTPSTNRDVLVLVTETENETAEKALEQQLHSIPSLQTITLVSGHKES